MAESAIPTTITDARAALCRGDISAVELTHHALHTVTATDEKLHAFLEVWSDKAHATAEHLDQTGQARDPHLLLAGIPLGVKDMICTREGHTTAASRILASLSAGYDATAIARLRQSGVVLIGKTNLDEFAMGSSTEYSAFGPTKNPWDTTRVAGGSSGGSTAAVASGQVLGALGTDTGGSIRQPANFCGVVGLKPTYGRVSRFGAIAYGSSFDQIGPIARTVRDTALLLQAMAGSDPRDATSAPTAVPDYLSFCGQSIKGLRIGVPREYMEEGVEPGVREVIQKALTALTEQGAQVVELSLPLTPLAIAVYFLIAKCEASTNLARYDSIRFGQIPAGVESLRDRYDMTRGQGFGPEVKRAILMGSYALSAGYYEAWYRQASKVRTLIRREFDEAFTNVDVIAGPCAPEVAFKLGSKSNDPLAMYLADALTVPMSVAGLPALSVPAGFSDGLPVGLQLTAPAFREELLFQVGSAYETAHPHWQKQPVGI